MYLGLIQVRYWLTDRSSFLQNGIRYAGAVVVQKKQTQVWRYSKDKVANTYTDSCDAFTTTCVHGSVSGERTTNLRREAETFPRY